MKTKKKIIPLLVFALSACSNNLPGGGESILTGIRGSLTLVDKGQEKACPYEYVDSEEIYYVTTLKYYELVISPVWRGSKSIGFEGDNITFDDESGSYKYNDTTMYYTPYGEFYYLGSPAGRPTYSAHFTRQGTFDLNFTYGSYESKIKIICDNGSDKYDEYRYDMSDIFPWAKSLNLDDIDKVRYEQGYIGVAPGSLKNISYSNEKTDISNAYNYLLSKVMISETNEHQITGGWYSIVTFYSGDNSYNLKISNSFIYGDETLSSNNAYHIQKIPGSTKIENPYQEAYSFITYGTDECYAFKVNEEDTEGILINYLDELEFIEWDEDTMDINEPSYYIDDGLKLSSKLYIYDINRFKYNDVFYKVIGDINFSNLF